MGISLRAFLVKDDDTIERLALSRYDRLLERDSKESFPQFAGKRVRYALVVLDLENRKPVSISRIQYSFLSFDSEGKIEPSDCARESRLAFEILPSFDEYQNMRTVIHARHRFGTKRYEEEYLWKPSVKIEKALIEAVFDTGKL